jgi:hydrogenase maturation protein HypF
MRPFLYREAAVLELAGWIRNDTRGVVLELEGGRPALDTFVDRLRSAPPPRAVVGRVMEEWLEPTGLRGLEILASDGEGERSAAVLPDLATCPACMADIGIGADANAGLDRRHGYAFTNCTDCGPRFSIVRALPYDRPNTTMAGFELCPSCREEYEDPLDRRFHAQPTACPECGPRLTVVAGPGAPVAAESAPDHAGGSVAGDRDALLRAAASIVAGEVVAVKGLGGFHLVVDAASDHAIAALRQRKYRPTKPLAVMVRDLAMARRVCHVPDEAAAVLASPEAPIVLLPRRPDAPVADAVAPGNPYLGLMLPYTPLHHLLLAEVGRPIVATSGNLSDEPICIDDDEAAARLGHVADRFLLHDRPIERPVDDSVVQWLAGAPRLVRRSRGYAPLPVTLSEPVAPILAVGGQLKNTIALARGTDVFLSQHIGDLETPQAGEAFERVIADFLRLYEVDPVRVAHDLHPDYASSMWVREHAGEVPTVAVQHHHAHLASCLADNDVAGPALGVIWDGTGLGPDGTIWGGEFLAGDASGYRRVAHLRPFRLPGGDAAVKEPRRVALALAYEAWGPEGLERVRGRAVGADWTAAEVAVLERMIATGFRAPWTTSAGRLFDGVAALLGLQLQAGFEGEAAMAVEYAVDPRERGAYAFPVHSGVGAPLVVDWAPALGTLLEDAARGVSAGIVAARFHNGLAAAIADVASRADLERVALSGGCFQNVVLTERTVGALEERGLEPLLHRRVPANDGGLSLGQVAIAAAIGRDTD